MKSSSSDPCPITKLPPRLSPRFSRGFGGDPSSGTKALIQRLRRQELGPVLSLRSALPGCRGGGSGKAMKKNMGSGKSHEEDLKKT